MTKSAIQPNESLASGAPLYRQIYLVLRAQIVDGAYRDGDLLPGEQEIMTKYDVSRITARRALDELAKVGMAVRLQGRGTFARAPAAERGPQGEVEGSLEGLLDNLMIMGLSTDVKVVEFGYQRAGVSAASALGISTDDEVQRAVRVRYYKGAPISHLTTCVPAEIGRTFTRDDLESTPILNLFERARLVVGAAEQSISATLAEPAVATALDVEIGSPLISLSRVVRDADERAIEWLSALYPPQRYRHHMRLNLNRKGGVSQWEPV